MRLLPRTLRRARSRADRFPRRFWTLIAGEGVQSLGVGLFLPYVALYLTGPIGASGTEAGVVLALWSFASLAATPLGGSLADRIGRRPVMLAGLGGGGACSIAFGLASNLDAVGALIVLWSVAESVVQPAASAYVTDVVEPGLRTEAFGIWRLAGNAAIAVGPPLGALVVWLSSLRVTFVIAGGAYLGYVLIAWRWLPETLPARAEHEPPPRFREALRDRVLLTLALGVALSAYLYAQYEDVLGVFAHRDRGVAVATWGLVFTVNPVLVTLLQYPIARWAGRRPARLVLSTAALLEGASFLLLLPFHGLGALVAAVVVLTLGEMLAAPTGNAFAASLAPTHLRGSYQAVMNLAWSATAGPALIVGLWLVGRGEGELMLWLAAPLALVAALAFVPLPDRRVDGETRASPLRGLSP